MQNHLQLENSLFSGNLDSSRPIAKDLRCQSSIKSDLFFFEKHLSKPKKVTFPESRPTDPMKSDLNPDDSIWLGDDKHPSKRGPAISNQLHSLKSSSKIDFEHIPATISPAEFQECGAASQHSRLGQMRRKLSLDQLNSSHFSKPLADRLATEFLYDTIKMSKENEKMKWTSLFLNAKNRKLGGFGGNKQTQKCCPKMSRFGLLAKMQKDKSKKMCRHGKGVKCLDLKISTLRQFEQRTETNESDLIWPRIEPNGQFRGRSEFDMLSGNNVGLFGQKGGNGVVLENSGKLGARLDFGSKISKKGIGVQQTKCFIKTSKLDTFKWENSNFQKKKFGSENPKQGKIRKIISKKETKKFVKRLKNLKNPEEAKEACKKEHSKKLNPVAKDSFSNSEKSLKTFSSKETVLELESKVKPSVLTFLNLMIDFFDEMILQLQTSCEECIQGPDMMRLFVKYIVQLQSKGMLMDHSVVEDQIKVLQSLAKDFRLADLEFIKKFFLLSRTISSNYEGAEKYFVDKETRSVYLMVDNNIENDTNLSKKSFFNPKYSNLIRFNDYFRLGPAQVSANSNRPVEQVINRSEHLVQPKSSEFGPAEPGACRKGCKPERKPACFKKVRKNRKNIKKKKKVQSCKCSKSKCLRLHCSCFRSGKFCGDDCNCKGCFNKIEFKPLVQKVINFTKNINSHAFDNRILEIEQNGKTIRLMSGCSCSKNQCLKNYCECRKNGLGCSPLCKCENCKNHRIELDPDVARNLYKKNSRKKKKIIFKSLRDDRIEVSQKILGRSSKK